MEIVEKQIERASTNLSKKFTAASSLPKIKDYILFKIKEEIVKTAANVCGTEDIEKDDLAIDLPPAHVKADLSIGLFNLAKKAGMDPVKFAKELGAAIEKSGSKFIQKTQPAGPYLNIVLNKKVYGNIAAEIGKLGDDYGKSNIHKKKLAVLDFSSPNIAKPMGVGHLRSTVIGQAIANIYEATGYTTIKDNHLGDWGTQFGKLIYAYQNWGNKEEVDKNPIVELNKLYVRFSKEAEANPELDDAAREIFKKLESGDKELIKIWKEFSDLSVKEFNKIYKIFGVEFDTYIGESFFAEKAEEEVAKALKKNLARKDEESGAIAVDTLLGVPSFLLRKQDGSTLYISRDLATLKFRVNEFKPNIILYVVGEEQKLNFLQLFELAKHMGYLKKTEARHIDFGLVMVGGEKMSTRKGTLVELSDLISQSVAKAKQIITEKDKDLSEAELEEISEIVGIGAIIYNDLRQSRSRNISFNWERMLDFEGGSAAYLQYTHARINSIIEKANADRTPAKLKAVFENESEFALARKMMFFPKIILEAQRHDSPHLIAVYLEELAQLFNHFYNEVSIIGTEDEELRLSRIMLINSVATVIKNGLALLNIKVSDKI